ncbi:MAG: (E)-4-hydroxy-3-methylbut-2-enyl-diphosphate synthase [Paludibacteraceae bacterium]|nr:(E)-4-hydroxy-3-methylbut-2-enyl-diphosphate synthase [Paludibacteraceae bacterium]
MNRRLTKTVQIGNLQMGGNNPVRVQSMLNTFTTDTDACVAQAIEVIEAGGELVRLTTQGVKEAANMANIKAALRAKGYDTPLVADVHFNPNAASEAALHIEKVRINPGNYASTYEEIRAKFIPFLTLCKEHGTAIRIGVNHGSLGARMLDKYGDTPEGMTESCLEFLRICKEQDFNNVVISVKASNTRVMIHTVRQMVRRMDAEGLNFPIHLGVTEAGEGEDGRIKSAVGIGTLLLEGIGDTIRVSLSEDPANEIPVARALVSLAEKAMQAPAMPACNMDWYNGEKYSRRDSIAVGEIGGGALPVVWNAGTEVPQGVMLMVLDHDNPLEQGRYLFGKMQQEGNKQPVIVYRKYTDLSLKELQLTAAAQLGSFFIDGLADGICIEAEGISAADTEALGYSILQAARARMSKTEYISCPSCGRTLFDIQTAIARIKAKTSHLTTLKIGIMGCIVNGPGEMADADYGYVGAGRGKISLYKGQNCIEKNIPEEEAVDRLIELIKANGDWFEAK